MRIARLAAVSAALALATCTPAERGVVVAPSGPQFDSHVQDLVGTPDMIVDTKTLATSWVVYDHEIREGSCSLQEANLTPGQYRLLRFTVVTPNIGDADIYIGDPNRHWDPNGDGDGSDSDGLFENNACHRHYHFRNYALYQLIDGSGQINKARKQGFCHMFKESNYANNIGQVRITIPDHPGKTGFGPGAESNPPADDIVDDENRPDK